MRSIRLLLVTTAVVLVALGASSTAFASRGISLSSSSIGAGGRLTMNGNIICDMLYTVSLTRNPVSKITGVDQATLTGTIRNCAGGGWTGAGTVLAGITVRYQSFSGTLPNITGITMSAPNFGIQFATIVGLCLYGGDLTGLSFLVNGGSLTGIDFTNTSTISRVGGSPLCPAAWTLRGVMAVLGTPPTTSLV